MWCSTRTDPSNSCNGATKSFSPRKKPKSSSDASRYTIPSLTTSFPLSTESAGCGYSVGMVAVYGLGTTTDEQLLRELRAARRTEFLIILGGGVLSLTTTILAASGHERAAQAIGAVGIVTGTVYAAVRLAENS